MKLPVGHLSFPYQLPLQGPDLQSPEHIGRLVERRIAALDRTPHLGSGIATFMAHPLYKKIHSLSSLHRPQVKSERENDPRAAVLAPEQHPDPVLG